MSVAGISAWALWVAFGLAIAILELFVTGYIFAGFALGALATGAILGFGLPGAGWVGASLTNSIVVFSVVSVLAWLALRQTLGLRKGQARTFDHDINED
ncbi:NfeD family protein [Roseicitreum antarcticum]|uniref:NfeD-like C-terminal, partner-binding n=1 Tax=Roseicitreum antarcticum TaxID=564137 RepID=A0A1H2XGR4_9RHOB|nr:hypothetical protein [Roseicitreum antarcticum]SDW92001.1 hypothetical protein SAMN04488238_104188 [Roseicitreum antarcticum]